MSPAGGGCPVEVSVRALHQRAKRLGAVGAFGLGTKAVERGQLALGCDLEHRATLAGPTEQRRPVEVAVGALHETRCRKVAVGTSGLGTKAVKRGYFAPRCDFEDRAIG